MMIREAESTSDQQNNIPDAVSPPLLVIKNLKVHFFGEENRVVRAVDGIDLTIRKREIVGIVGESGCGKSTLGYSIIRLLAQNARIVDGSVTLDGEDLLKKDERQMRKVRGRDVSMVFQDPLTSLNPVFKIKEQIGRVIQIHEKLGKKEAYNRGRELLKLVEFPDPDVVLASYPHQLIWRDAAAHNARHGARA